MMELTMMLMTPRLKNLLLTTTFAALVALPPAFATAEEGSAYTQPVPALGNGAASVFESRISDLENQLRGITGKLEQVEFTNRQLRQQLERQQSDSDMRIKSLEQRFETQANIAASMEASDASEIVDNGTPPTGVASINNFNTAPQAQPRGNNVISLNNARQNPPEASAPASNPNDGTSQEQYDRAFSLLRQANYDDAEAAFKAFIANNPNDKLIDNAKYWLAETYYVRGNHQEAAVAFAESYQAAPSGTKAPDSLLKLAMSLAGMNNAKDACVALNELKNKFPNASASVKSRAEQESKQQKCGQAAVARNATAKKTTPAKTDKPKAE
jgi:tol-pal system protein YbgF